MSFAVGERVRVHAWDPPEAPQKPHLRTPWYVRGKEGEIERIVGAFRNPETLAYGGDGLPKQTLYRVRFAQRHLWPDYDGAANDTVEVEIYEHWLAKATEQRGAMSEHEAQESYRLLGEAVRELLIEKSVFTAAEFERAIARMDARGPEQGALMVARAWCDPDYKRRLLADGSAAAEELGIAVDGTLLVVLENTETVHNVFVCTLCSCYPRAILGLPPGWYKEREYRSRVVREPRTVLREFGTELAGAVEVRVHDSTAEMRYLVLPRRPAGTEGWSQERLARLVTRDSMIGVTHPLTPDQVGDPAG